MKTIILILRKIRREVGLNLFYVIWCAVKVIFYSMKPAPRAIRAALKQDEQTLLGKRADAETLLEQAKFYRARASDKTEGLFEELKKIQVHLDQNRDVKKYPDPIRRPWQTTVNVLAELASMTWPGNPRSDEEALDEFVTFLDQFETERQEQGRSLFRYYPLNKGKNDYWEWYLVPWHRTYGALTVALLDERMRPRLMPIWNHYDRWFRNERPWMTRLLVGSNVAAVNSGYALHALMGYLIDDDAEEKKKYLSRYLRHTRGLHKALTASFDTGGRVSIPFEGITYSGFWFRTILILGLIQRALGLEHSLLDQPALSGLSEYVWKSRTPDGDFQTSGDSHPTVDKGAIDRGTFGLLAELEDPYARQLASLFSEPHFLAGHLKEEIKGELQSVKMATPDLIVSRRKGEVLLNFQNETFESIMVVFHANALNPLVNTLHFGLKPGHLFVYCKRREENKGRWVLTDPGYVNYFRGDQTDIERPDYNTLDKQKLLTPGWVRVRERDQAVELTSFTLLPLHRRTVTFSYDDTSASLVVKDFYLGNRRVHWNFETHLEQTRAFFRQERRIDL